MRCNFFLVGRSSEQPKVSLVLSFVDRKIKRGIYAHQILICLCCKHLCDALLEYDC
jgi:hypothetical protein